MGWATGSASAGHTAGAQDLGSPILSFTVPTDRMITNLEPHLIPTARGEQALLLYPSHGLEDKATQRWGAGGGTGAATFETGPCHLLLLDKHLVALLRASQCRSSSCLSFHRMLTTPL